MCTGDYCLQIRKSPRTSSFLLAHQSQAQYPSSLVHFSTASFLTFQHLLQSTTSLLQLSSAKVALPLCKQLPSKKRSKTPARTQLPQQLFPQQWLVSTHRALLKMQRTCSILTSMARHLHLCKRSLQWEDLASRVWPARHSALRVLVLHRPSHPVAVWTT